jgi:hypothetical protein
MFSFTLYEYISYWHHRLFNIKYCSLSHTHAYTHVANILHGCLNAWAVGAAEKLGPDYGGSDCKKCKRS